ncbi:uncharacterized protein LOC17880509 [Capsella rubella]|uniref:uncharacterized protein LOC17880509 n=1 Tax=Capsella rubella TaxID=81985 RepID=UPI000CD5207E|nr:uncharacterized protein LOC17880509 [Capsella rubella]
MVDQAKQEPKTMVWWDINSCPVPDGYDASMVAQSIELALKKAGHTGPLTITAIGYLNYTLKQMPGVLHAISSSGILLKNVINDFRYILMDLSSWAYANPTPATLMFISGAVSHTASICSKFSLLQRLGHTTLLACPQEVCFAVLPRDLLWESLLKDGMSSGETRRQKQCCETAWLCSMCKNSCPLTEGDGSFQGKSFEDFTSHLKSEYHALCELSMVSRPISKKLANLTECSNKKSSKRSIEEEEEEEEEDQYWEDEEWERLTV